MKRSVEVIKPKPIKGPRIPVFINFNKLNFIFLDFSIGYCCFKYKLNNY